MKKLALSLFPLLLLCSCPPICVSDIENYTLIDNVNVVDVIGGEVRVAQKVVLKDSMIYYIGEEGPETRIRYNTIIDGMGKYLIPGLWDMHFHLAWEPSNDSLLFQPLLAHGITGIRDMGGSLEIQQDMKAKIAADPTLGPEIYGAGPILDGNPPVMYDFSIPLGEAADVDAVLDSLVNAGSDFFKTYSLIKEPVLALIAEYAQQHNLSFAGHLSEYIRPEQSIALGQKSIEHLNRLDDIWQTDTARLQQIAQLMQTHKTWLCPTLIIYHLKAQMRDTFIIHPAYDAFIHPVLQQEWQSSRNRRLAQNNEQDWENQALIYEEQQQLVAFLQAQGIQILAGSDFAGMPYVYPGVGLHQEMKLLTEAGLSNAEALATATINPALYLNWEERYGTVSAGKYADLVLLTENPLIDISAISTVEKVFRKGKVVIMADAILPSTLKAKDTLPIPQFIHPVPGRHIRQ